MSYSAQPRLLKLASLGVVIYEAYLPVTQEDMAVPPALFRHTFDELAEEAGFVETWPVYRQLGTPAAGLSEQEFYRYQVEVPDTEATRNRLGEWRETQEHRFHCDIWMIRYSLP